MTEEDLCKRYTITIGYLEAPPVPGVEGPRRYREATIVAAGISEDDAIWTALRAFRSEEVRTWIGWPRDVILVTVDEGTSE